MILIENMNAVFYSSWWFAQPISSQEKEYISENLIFKICYNSTISSSQDNDLFCIVTITIYNVKYE